MSTTITLLRAQLARLETQLGTSHPVRRGPADEACDMRGGPGFILARHEFERMLAATSLELRVALDRAKAGR